MADSLSEANLYHCVGFIGEGEKGGREVPWYNGDKNRIWKMFIDRKTIHLRKRMLSVESLKVIRWDDE